MKRLGLGSWSFRFSFTTNICLRFVAHTDNPLHFMSFFNAGITWKIGQGGESVVWQIGVRTLASILNYVALVKLRVWGNKTP